MAPWDESTYFQPWVYNTVNLTQNVKTVVVKPDPLRIAVMFSTGSAGGVISVAPGTDANSAPPFSGMFVSNSSVPWVLTFRDVGPIVMSAWWALSTGLNMSISVITIALKSWPPERAHDADAQVIASLARLIAAIRSEQWQPSTTP